MPGLARVVIPSYPHHITRRGNRRQATFFSAEDCNAYIALMAEWCAECGAEVWAYRLMPNHVHMIAVPSSEDGLRRAIGEAHRQYTRRVNCWTSRRGERTGRPAGSDEFVAALEALIGRTLRRRKPGPKRNESS